MRRGTYPILLVHARDEARELYRLSLSRDHALSAVGEIKETLGAGASDVKQSPLFLNIVTPVEGEGAMLDYVHHQLKH